MTPVAERVSLVQDLSAPGRWTTPKVYSAISGILENTLATWRYQDMHADPPRNEALPGFPKYRRWGRTVRYWLEPNSYDPAMFASIPATRYKSRKKTVQAAVQL